MAENVPEETPKEKEELKAQKEALKEPVVVAKNPAGLIIRLIGLEILMDLAVLLISGILLVLGAGARAVMAIFISLLLIKTVVYAVFAFLGLLHWTHLDYYLSETQLIFKRLNRRLTSADEMTHELRSIFKVTSTQGWLGRFLNYGDITLEMTGYDQKIHLEDIKDPDHYKTVFDKYVSAPAA